MSRITLNLPRGEALRIDITSDGPEIDPRTGAPLGPEAAHTYIRQTSVHFYHVKALAPGAVPQRGVPREAVEISEAEADALFVTADIARAPADISLRAWLQHKRITTFDWSGRA